MLMMKNKNKIKIIYNNKIKKIYLIKIKFNNSYNNIKKYK